MTSPAESNPIGRTYIQSSGVEPGSLYLSFSITLAGGKIVGDDLFRLVSFEGQESVSEPYEFQLELHGNTEPSENPYPPVKPATTTKPNTKEPPPTPRPPIETIQFEDVIGRPITVALMGAIVGYQDETGASKGQEPKAIIAQPLSYFSGIVASFAMEIPGVYRIVMRPSLWRLTLTNRYRVYPQTNIQNLIRTLLKQHDLIEGRDFSVDAMQGLALARKQDWFQAGETDFEFLRRLMGKSHIYFYFIQTPSGHKVIFANYASYQPVGVTLRYTYTGTDELAMQQADVIFQYSYQQSLTSTGVRGVFARQDAAWEYDEVARSYSYETPKGLKGEGSLPFNQYKIYQYGGSVGEVSNFAQVTSEVLDSSSQQLSGASYCPLFHVGHFFTMTGRDMDETAHPYPVRPNLEGKTFVLTQVKHKASLDGTYQNEFQASIDRRSITPFSIQDTQQGVVMAVVLAHDGVPPNGWKYYDKSNFSYGTQMMSDAEGDQTELAAKGVYVRFSTDSGNEVTWVKLASYMQNVPEIGVTVMVARAQDESELPEIQSIVQANGQSDVVPGEWTANTHVGSNYSTSYSDSVGIRFGAYMSYDLNYAIKLLENKYETGGGKAAGERFKDVSYSKGGGYSFSAAEAFGTSPSDETALYGPYGPGDNTKMLSASESFGSNYSRRYSPVSSDHSTIDISYSFSTIGQTESYTTVTGFSYSQIHNMGTVTNISVTDGVTTNTSTNNADVINTNTINANSTNTSTTTGDTTNTTTNNGKVTNTSVTDGVTTNTSTNNADVINTNTINANSTNTSTTTGDTTSTTTNNGKVTTTTTTDGATSNTSTNNADVTNTNTINASSTNTTTVTGTNKSITHVGVQTDSSMVGLSNSNRLVGASFDFGVTGLQQSVTAAASATSVSIQGNGNSVNIVGANTEVRIWGVGTAFLSRGAQAAVNLPLSEITLPTIIKMIL